MTTLCKCPQNNDPLKLVREGTSQEQRFALALHPSYAPVNERKPEHWMVFAQAYSKYLKYYDLDNNTVAGDWGAFFGKDVSTLFAVVSVQDVGYYKSRVKEAFDFLNDSAQATQDDELKAHLGYLFSYVGTLARQLDSLKEGLLTDVSLPEVTAFKSTLQNLINRQLAPVFERLLGYYKADDLNLITDTAPDDVILGSETVIFSRVYRTPFSVDWITTEAPDWNSYLGAIKPLPIDASGNVFEQINRLVTHNLFTAIFDQFLKVYARIVSEAQKTLAAAFKWDGHEPHYTLFLAFLKLFEQTNIETNTLTQRHLDFYYKEVLKLKEKPAVAGHAHLLVELAKPVESHELKSGKLFQAGKDDKKIEAFFANDRDFVANQAKITELRTVYRHGKEFVSGLAMNHEGRIFASPVANSDDGKRAELTTVDHSWHPFFNKIYRNEELTEIKMPQAEIGFAIASHYLWMAEGERTITVDFTVAGDLSGLTLDHKGDLVCLLTSEKGWFEKTAEKFISESGFLRLVIKLSGSDPAVSAYLAKTHGYNFAIELPILLIKLRHTDTYQFLYSQLQEITIEKIELTVAIDGLKTLAVSNDFGPVDTSKPFQPFGASPVANSSLIIGSKEVFQKKLTNISISWLWFISPVPFKTNPMVNVSFLNSGQWRESHFSAVTVDSIDYSFIDQNDLDLSVVDLPDLTPNEFYTTTSKHGFIRLSINNDFGHTNYQKELRDYLIDQAKLFPLVKLVKEPIPVPIAPVISDMVVHYSAQQIIKLNEGDIDKFTRRNAKFFHLTPFGHAEQHPYLKNKTPDTETNLIDRTIYLLPPLKHINITDNKRLKLLKGKAITHEAEFYIGVTGLKPPQNLAVLFQVVDGTADPRSNKPEQYWSYLRDNEWVSFASNEIQDKTDGLINSGIITFAVPRDASSNNTLLPAGMHWIRVAVASESDAVCRLFQVSAQALTATFIDQGNDPAFPAKVLPAGTISKLEQPDASVKQITQPFPSFGGRGAEPTNDFYVRISERLRHKDRAIALWDYERLILEAFPQIYKVKCLNHTHYETDQGREIYQELAAGHVTIVTLPNQSFQKLRDPLKPYTSLGLLTEIETFLKQRLSCFVKLHVKNPQFEEVAVGCKVCLRNGGDQTYYANKLREAITRFLSPWAFSDNAHPSFGGKIYKSVLINFVEELPYVDYVTDFQLFHSVIINGKPETSEKNEVEGSKAISILVSVSAPTHKITIINPAEQAALRETCGCES